MYFKTFYFSWGWRLTVTLMITSCNKQFDLAILNWYKYLCFHWPLQQSSAEMVNQKVTIKSSMNCKRYVVTFLSFFCKQMLYTLSGLVGILTVTSPENRTWYTKGPLTPATILSSWNEMQLMPCMLSSFKRTRLMAKDLKWYNDKCGPPPQTYEIRNNLIVS